MSGGKFMQFNDFFDYTKEEAPEAADNFTQGSFEELCRFYDLPEDLAAQIEIWVDEQIKLGVREFIKKLTIKMSQSLHGFCVLRALGYHAQIESNGVAVNSLRQIAKHFNCSHQYVDKLTKDLESQLGVQADTLEIERKTYSMTVEPPKGWVTYGQAMKTFGIKRTALLRIINENKIPVKNYARNAKIIPLAMLKKFSGKESITNQNLNPE
jgi:hypothetical protein